jgi:hypothetical protein
MAAELFYVYTQTDGRTDGQTDITKLIVAFQNCEYGPKNQT